MTVHVGRRLAPLRPRALAAGFLLLAAAACAETPAGTDTAPTETASSNALTRVVVTPATASIPVGDSVVVRATGYTAAGSAVTPIACGWSADDPAVTRMSADVARGLAAGTTLVKAGCGGIIGSASLTVSAQATPPGALLAASVTVAPAGASIPVGATQQLTATARDAAGNVVNHAATWSSSAPAVASVSATGLVSALALGTAAITATVDGKSAAATITVTTALPPPPGLLFTDDFENGFAALQNGAGWENTAEPNVTISTDVAHGGSHSLEFTFPGKAECLDASAELRFSLGRAMQEVWLEWYIYYPAGGEGGSAPYYHRWEYPVCSPPDQPDNNKFLALYGPTYQAEPTLLMQTWTTTLAASVPPIAPGDSRIQTAATQAGLGGAAPGYADDMTFISGAADRGRWIQIRLHARVADFGQNDGVVQMWKDGVLILSNNNLPWYDSTNQANYISQGYLLGWSNSGYAQTTNIYIDDFRIIGQNPGW